MIPTVPTPVQWLGPGDLNLTAEQARRIVDALLPATTEQKGQWSVRYAALIERLDPGHTDI